MITNKNGLDIELLDPWVMTDSDLTGTFWDQMEGLIVPWIPMNVCCTAYRGQ